MNKTEQDRKEQWIRQVWESAKELPRLAPPPVSLYNMHSSQSGSMDATIDQVIDQDDEMGGKHNGY